MVLNPEQQGAIRSAARWAIAVVVVVALNMVLVLGRLTDAGIREAVVGVTSLVIMGWQALGLAVAALAFGSRPTAARFEAGLSGLRTFAKVGVLTLPILAGGIGMTCEMSARDVTTSTDDLGGER